MVYISALMLGLLGGIIAFGLITVLSRLRGSEDGRVELLEQMLPGVNCGACGMAGCGDMARAMASGDRNPGACPLASDTTANRIAELLNVDAGTQSRKVAQVICRGKADVAPPRADYIGIKDCRAAQTVSWGPKGCTFGCLGFGTCVGECPVDAIRMAADGVPIIDTDACTGCGLCVAVCPRDTLHLIDESQPAVIRCMSQASGKTVRSICSNGCIQCKICIRECPQNAISLKDGRIQIDPALCDGCGVCAEKCPNGVIDVHLREIFRGERVTA